MAKEWIEKRFQGWTENDNEWDRRRQLDQKATQVADSLFDGLKDQVKQDLDAYNERFSQFTSCQCRYVPCAPFEGNGFRVNRAPGLPAKSVLATKDPRQTVVKLLLTVTTDALNNPAVRSDHMEIRADYATGEILFYHHGQKMRGLPQPSEAVLDMVLCGPKENALPDEPDAFYVATA